MRRAAPSRSEKAGRLIAVCAILHSGYSLSTQTTLLQKNRRISRRLTLAALGLGMLGGCGFHLRGQFSLSDALSPMSIQGADPELADAVAYGLRQSGVTVVEPGSRSAGLKFTHTAFDRQVRTTDADGRTTGYTYRYTVAFEVVDKRGHPLQQQRITQSRSLDYAPATELQATEEEVFLKRSMEKEITAQILSLLSRL